MHCWVRQIIIREPTKNNQIKLTYEKSSSHPVVCSTKFDDWLWPLRFGWLVFKETPPPSFQTIKRGKGGERHLRGLVEFWEGRRESWTFFKSSRPMNLLFFIFLGVCVKVFNKSLLCDAETTAADGIDNKTADDEINSLWWSGDEISLTVKNKTRLSLSWLIAVFSSWYRSINQLQHISASTASTVIVSWLINCIIQDAFGVWTLKINSLYIKFWIFFSVVALNFIPDYDESPWNGIILHRTDIKDLFFSSVKVAAVHRCHSHPNGVKSVETLNFPYKIYFYFFFFQFSFCRGVDLTIVFFLNWKRWKVQLGTALRLYGDHRCSEHKGTVVHLVRPGTTMSWTFVLFTSLFEQNRNIHIVFLLPKMVGRPSHLFTSCLQAWEIWENPQVPSS